MTETATCLFIERGYKEIKIPNASAETGIHIGSICNTFRDKEDIVCEIAIRDYAAILEHAEMVEAEDIVRKVAFPMVAELRLARSGPNVARIPSVAYASSKIMDALTNMQRGLLERHCDDTRLSVKGTSAIKRRMGAVNGLISGLIACSSAGNVNDDAVIEMSASRPLSGSQTCTTNPSWTRPSGSSIWIRRRDTSRDSEDDRSSDPSSERVMKFAASDFHMSTGGRFRAVFSRFVPISAFFVILKKWAPASFIYLPDIHGNARPAKTGCDDGES